MALKLFRMSIIVLAVPLAVPSAAQNVLEIIGEPQAPAPRNNEGIAAGDRRSVEDPCPDIPDDLRQIRSYDEFCRNRGNANTRSGQGLLLQRNAPLLSNPILQDR